MERTAAIDEPFVVKYNLCNRRVYTFLKQSADYHLEPLYQQILNIVHLNSPLNRYTLLHLMHKQLETKQDVATLLTKAERDLIQQNFIMVEEYQNWKLRVEVDKMLRMKTLIVPSAMGGFSIKHGDMPPVGRWSSVEEIIDVLQRYGADKQEMTPELLSEIAGGG